jgi:hypothetical protein
MGSQTNNGLNLKERPSPPSGVRVSESGEEFVVRMDVDDREVEVRIPVSEVCRPRKPRKHIPGFNADATPC